MHLQFAYPSKVLLGEHATILDRLRRHGRRVDVLGSAHGSNLALRKPALELLKALLLRPLPFPPSASTLCSPSFPSRALCTRVHSLFLLVYVASRSFSVGPPVLFLLVPAARGFTLIVIAGALQTRMFCILAVALTP